MITKNKLKKIVEEMRKTKKVFLIGFLILILAILIVGAILLINKSVKPSLKGVFYFKTEGENSKLFYMVPNKEPEYLLDLPSEEVGTDYYKVPKHSYLSHNGQVLIYFERTKEMPIGTISEEEGLVAYRIFYKPEYIDLKTGSIKDINQDIDSGSLVFSTNDKKIAWIKQVEESTVEELESKNKKREVWLSDFDGQSAERLAILGEKVILLQRWSGHFIYFWGIQGTGYYSLGRINAENGQVEYLSPQHCSKNLSNCQNFKFSSSGQLFMYEAGSIKEDKKTIDLFIESFDNQKSWQILVENYISDRLWLPDENSIVYTEQVTEKKGELKEKIHLVNLETKEDKEIYSGSYISQLIPNIFGNYLYFLEKETDEKFNLVELNIEKGEARIIDSGEYNWLRIFSSQ